MPRFAMDAQSKPDEVVLSSASPHPVVTEATVGLGKIYLGLASPRLLPLSDRYCNKR